MAVDFIDRNTEKSLIELINDYNPKYHVDIDEDNYKRIDLRLWDKNRVGNIISKLKLKDIGGVMDFPNYLPQPETIPINAIENYETYKRIYISKKYNCVIISSSDNYGTALSLIINTKNIKKMMKLIKPIISNDEKYDIFGNVDFNCKKNEYIDITYKYGKTPDEDLNVAIKRKIEPENLVFDPNSELFNIMNDIHTFFEDKTKKLYKDMDIIYKRGIVIYSDPGNGKSSMIREMIRQLHDVNKIVITSDRHNITMVLSALFKKLNNQKSIIVIEDIDSMIDDQNRSEFLNLLDGVSAKSGLYFVATTNYPDKIDPAFINRSGRFDRTYKIDNPSELLRKEYFKSKNISGILSDFKIHKENSEDKDLGIVDLCTKYTEGFSMANLKEFMITLQYTLASRKADNIEDAAIEANKILLIPIPKSNEYGVYGRYRPMKKHIVEDDE